MKMTAWDPFQSEFGPHHGTDIALVALHNDMLRGVVDPIAAPGSVSFSPG